MLGPSVKVSSRQAFVGIGLFSAVAVAGLVWLLYLAVPAQPMPAWAAALPGYNALMNSLSASVSLAAWMAARRGKRGLHKAGMLAALVASAAFLVGYVVYHHYHGDTPFGGQGMALRVLYFSLLISHVLLSIAVLPLLLTVLWFATSGDLERHRRLARWIWPLWMYVSITGVTVYLMLKPYY
jgi:putative membrane protein